MTARTCLLFVVCSTFGFASVADAQGVPTQPTGLETSAAQPHPMVKAIGIAKRASESAGSLTDYTATLYRNMWVGNQYAESTVQLKHKTDPFSVYLLFQQPNPGREVLYIDGWNNNQIYAHEGSGPLSYFGSISLDPNGSQAMQGSKYPITNIGIKRMIDMVIEKWEAQLKFQSPADVTVKLYPSAKLGDEACKAIETTFAKPHPQYPFARFRLFLTPDQNLPFAVQVFAFPQQSGAEMPKIEDVRYMNLKPNVGLVAMDFDYKNPAYSF